MNDSAVSHGNIEPNILLLDIATRDVVSFGLDGRAREAAQVMAQRRISSVVVTDGEGHPAGIVTERNILHAMQSGGGPESLLRDIMSSPVVSVPSSITVLEAYRLCLQRSIRHLVIVDGNGRLTGVASETDFRQHLNLPTLAGRRKIAAVARHSALTLPPSASLAQALGLMLEQHKSCVVVLEGRKPVGIVTERDVVRFYSDGSAGSDVVLGEVMVRPVLTIAGDASCGQAAEMMLARKVRHLVVVDESGFMSGLLSEHDLTQIMVVSLSEEREGIENNFLRTLINTLPDLIWLKDAQGIYLACNARFERFFGAKERDIVGKSDYDFMSREQAEFFREHDRMAMEKGEPSVNEEWIAFADDGHRELLETIKTPMRSRSGELVGVLGIGRDITERMHAAGALRASEEKLRGLYELSPMGIALTDMQGHYLEFNDAFRNICGYSREELNRLDYWALTPKEYADREAEQLESLNSKGYYGPYEKEYIRKDGNRIPLRLNGVLVHDHEGKSYIWSIVEDISERKRAEEMLRKLSAAVEQSAASVVITDLEARIQYVNPRFVEATGYSAAEAIGQNPRILQSGRTPRETYAELWGRLSSGREWNGELLNKRKNGELYWEDVSIAPIRNGEGVTTHYVGIKTDITARKQMEAALGASERRYRNLIENSPFCIHEIDLDGRLQSMNQAGLCMLGLDSEEKIRGIPYLSAVGEQDIARIRQSMQDAFAGTPSHFEFTGTGESPLYFKSCFIPIRDTDGRVIRLMGITEDFTERKRMERQVLESEELFRAVFNQVPGAVELIDPDTLRFIEANPAACDMLGYTREEYLQLRLTDTQAAILDEGELRASVRQIEELGGLTFENRHRCKNGDVLLVEVTARMLNLPGKRLLIGVWRDITERKRADEAIRESENKYRSLFETAGDGIFLQNAGGFIDCNEKGARMYGLAREQVIGRSPATLAPERQPDGRSSAEVAGEMIAAAMAGQSRQFEWQALRADGSPLDVEVNLSRIEYKGEACLQAVVRDISKRKRAEDALREREEIFSSIVNQAADSVLLLDAATMRFVEFNRMAHESLGYTREEFAQLTLADVQAEYNPEQLHRILDDAAASGRPLLIETQHRRKDGSIRPSQVSSRAITIRGKGYFSSIWSDITERKRAEENLRITASVFDTTQEAILITDADNLIIDVNPAFARITGYSREEVLGKNPRLLSSGRHNRDFYAAMWDSIRRKKSWRGEIWNRRKTGESYAELLSISAICGADGKVQRHIGVFSDISYLKEHEAELNRAAYYDALTGIPNRLLLADRMKQAIAQTSRERNMMAVCYLDLDGFKEVNDTLGHEAGDQVLVEMARRIGHTIRGGDTVARLGGDEFVVLLLGLEQGGECMATLERLLKAISLPLEIKGKPVTLGASIGVSIYPLDDEDSDTLLRHADQAMYVSKQSGKNRYHVYDPALDLRARNHYEFIQGIRDGLVQGRFELYYQPKIALASGELVGAEALIRWRHAERGLVLPAEFLPLIEKTELAIEIGEWVIAEALRQIDSWRRAGLDIEVSINISAHHLESPHFDEKLRQHLARYPDLPPNRLQIEVLETVALEDIVIVREIIESCRKLGVRFALDDFGTGYSSLSYLSSLPVDVLKIDQSFVCDMLDDKGDLAIVQGVIALARAFGREIVAEGIETDAHYRALLEMGCEVGQGYGIARPMAADELLKWQARR